MTAAAGRAPAPRRRLWPIIQRVWITAGLGATAIFVVWSLVAYRASTEARAALAPSAVVAVHHAAGVWRFVPAQGRDSNVALVFFPGALVDPVAYAPLARAAAESGFASYIVELPRRGAFGGAEDPELWARLGGLLGELGMPARWVAGGHSRGGVVASRVASERREGLAGLALVGTSHPRDVDLSALAMPVTKIVGTRDGLASREEVEANRGLLPASTRWVWVEGGNHSQFGWYGFQPGDRRATLPASEQRRRMTAAVLAALRLADAQPRPINEERP